MGQKRKPAPGGDDLEDDFVTDTHSNEVQVVSDDGKVFDDSTSESRVNKDNDTDANNEIDEAAKKERKRRKRRKDRENRRKKRHKKDKEQQELIKESGQAQLWEKTLKETYPKLSPLELEPFHHTEESFAAIPKDVVDLPRTLENLENVITAVYPKWMKKCKVDNDTPKKMPRVLIIGASGIRCADINRKLPAFAKLCKIGKLFAKHFKVREQVEYLERTVCTVASGTPGRVKTLLDQRAMTLDKLDLVVIDGSYRDVKECSIFQIREVCQELLALYKDHFIPHMRTHDRCRTLIF
eukprot:Clim_evm28s77 gene=Clim_evmTU28s77